jgi:hypothetical protein
VTVNDVALKTPQRSWGHVECGELVLRDAEGRELARARSADPYGVVDFSDLAARAAWQACFESLSRWQALWAPKVTSASVVRAGCRIANMPGRAHRQRLVVVVGATAACGWRAVRQLLVHPVHRQREMGCR